MSTCGCDFCAHSATQTSDGLVTTPYYLCFSPKQKSAAMRCSYVIKVAAVLKTRVIIILPSGERCHDILTATRHAEQSTGCMSRSKIVYDDWVLHINGRLQRSTNFSPAITKARNVDVHTQWTSFVQCTRIPFNPADAKRPAPSAGVSRRTKARANREEGAPSWWERQPGQLSYAESVSLRRQLMESTPPDEWTAEFIEYRLLRDSLLPPHLQAVERIRSPPGCPYTMCCCTFVHPDGTPIAVPLPYVVVRFISEYSELVSALPPPPTS